jgi:hypothetical protein
MSEPWDERVEGRLRDLADPSTELIVRQILRTVVERGCVVRIPPAVKKTYFNVAPPPGKRGGRACAVHVRSGSVEFQTDTFDVAKAIGLAEVVRHLAAGNKAAYTPATTEDVAIVERLLDAVLASR